MAETTKSKDPWAELRKPFPKEVISHIPKGGVTLDYVGHANITDRLNEAVGPENWNLEPLSFNEDGTPVITTRKDNAVMWARLTILGATKLCVGTASVSKFEVEKELIGDALRNGAMRFGVALDLWAKGELESQVAEKPVPFKEVSYDKAPEDPSRQVTDEPISDISLNKVRLRMKAKNITGDKATEFLDAVISKSAPTTEPDAVKLLAALEAE